MGHLRNFETGVFRRLRRDPPTGKIHRLAFWLLIVYLGLADGTNFPGQGGCRLPEPSARLPFFADPALHSAALALDLRPPAVEAQQPAGGHLSPDGPCAGGALRLVGCDPALRLLRPVRHLCRNGGDRLRAGPYRVDQPRLRPARCPRCWPSDPKARSVDAARSRRYLARPRACCHADRCLCGWTSDCL